MVTAISQLETPVDRHSTGWREDKYTTISISTLQPPINSVTLPEVETYSIPYASTRSHTHKPHTREMPSATHANQAQPIEIYTTYTQSDVRSFYKIKELLEIFERQGQPVSCHECEIIHSTAWQGNDHLVTAHLILLLVSTTFLNTDFCYCEQLCAAVDRHRRHDLCFVIPILLHPLHQLLLQRTPFGALDFLPTNGKAISEWNDTRKAYKDITDYLLERIDEISYYLNP